MPKCHRQFPPRSRPSSGGLPGGVFGISIIVVGVIVVVGGVQCREDNAQRSSVRVVSVDVRSGHVALGVAHSGVFVLPIGRGGRRSVIATVVVPPLLLPCCHGPMFVFLVIFVAPELSNIAAG
jgi:hypothetical protein